MSRGDHYWSYTCDRCARKSESLRVERSGRGVTFLCPGCVRTG